MILRNHNYLHKNQDEDADIQTIISKFAALYQANPTAKPEMYNSMMDGILETYGLKYKISSSFQSLLSYPNIPALALPFFQGISGLKFTSFNKFKFFLIHPSISYVCILSKCLYNSRANLDLVNDTCIPRNTRPTQVY